MLSYLVEWFLGLFHRDEDDTDESQQTREYMFPDQLDHRPMKDRCGEPDDN